VILEAMATGCPVVAARAGGITDILTDGQNGCLFSPGEDSDLVAVVRHLLEDGPFRQHIKQESRREAVRWSWEAATASLREQYWNVLAQTVPAAAPA
jgi:glycosyltransferase involved in cell wall biosynthesis